MNFENIIYDELNKAHAEILEITDENAIAEGNSILVSSLEMLLHFSDIARKQGLLALDDEAGKLPDDELLKELMLLIVDGTEPEYIKEVTAYRAAVLQLHDFKRVDFWLAVRGALLIQEGTSPYLIKKMLKNMLPIPAKNLMEEREKARQEAPSEHSILEGITKHWDNIETYTEHSMLTLLMTDILSTLPDISIQRIIRDMENYDFALAIKILSPVAKKALLNNCSLRLAEMICEQADYMGPVRASNAELAVKSILKIILSLEDAGELLLSKEHKDRAEKLLNPGIDYTLTHEEIEQLINSLPSEES